MIVLSNAYQSSTSMDQQQLNLITTKLLESGSVPSTTLSELSESLHYQLSRGSAEAITENLLKVYRQNCEFREEICKLREELGNKQNEPDVIQEKTKKEQHRHKNRTFSEETNDLEELEDMKQLFKQLTSTNQNLWERYNEMDTKAMNSEEKCRRLQSELDEICQENEELDRLNRQLLKENEQLVSKLEKVNLKTPPPRPIFPGVDTLPKEIELEKQPFYFGRIDRREAEELLSPMEEGCFCVRHCQMSLSDFTLSVRSRDSTRHFLIRRQGDTLFNGVHAFKSWTELIEFYQMKPLLQTGSRMLFLKNPATRE